MAALQTVFAPRDRVRRYQSALPGWWCAYASIRILSASLANGISQVRCLVASSIAFRERTCCRLYGCLRRAEE